MNTFLGFYYFILWFWIEMHIFLWHLLFFIVNVFVLHFFCRKLILEIMIFVIISQSGRLKLKSSFNQKSYFCNLFYIFFHCFFLSFFLCPNAKKNLYSLNTFHNWVHFTVNTLIFSIIELNAKLVLVQCSNTPCALRYLNRSKLVPP